MADDTVLSASYGRSIERPWAMENGLEGSCNYFDLHLGGDKRRSARAPTTVMKRGDRIRMVTGGGGGYGDPFTRPAGEVVAEVRADYITSEQARNDYGVVLSADGLSADAAATAVLRAGA